MKRKLTKAEEILIKALKRIVQESSSTRWPGHDEAFERMCVTIHDLAKSALHDVGSPYSIVERMREREKR